MKYSAGLIGDLSGTLGSVTASRSKYGTYFKRHTIPTNPQTLAQVAQRNAFAFVAQSWRGLTAGQQGDWQQAQFPVSGGGGSGGTITLSGAAAFSHINTIRRRIGGTLTLVTVPPTPTPAPITPPVAALADGDPGVLTLTFTAADDWNAPGGAVLVRCSRKITPGVKYAPIVFAVGSAIDPEAVATAFNLPFACAVGDIVDFECIATAPDGSRSAPCRFQVTCA